MCICIDCNNYEICKKKNNNIIDCEFFVKKKRIKKILKLGVKTNSIKRNLYESFL